jgi:excisionase family DNA binding protein
MAKKIPDVFSTHSAAKFCRVTPMTIIRWIDEGRIKAYKTPGGHRRIMRADLEDFCRRNEIPMQWEDRVTTGSRRVLIIDDDKSVVHAILDALFDEEENKDAETTFEVEHTDNPFDGGRLVTGFRPEVIFLDLNLPGVDAQKVARSIRKDPATAKSRVIGIASDGSHRPVELDDVLSRPVSKKAVRRVTGPLPNLKPR